MFVKLAESTVTQADIQSTEDILRDSDLQIEQQMLKLAAEHKAIAPLAKDFLYFTCVMMHAAEAALIDDSGEIKKHAGVPITAHWEKVGKEAIKWVCSDPSIKPYKNANCLTAGTDILMSDGSRKAIEDIVAGDEVITHNGRVRKVVETFKHEINSKIYNIKAKSHPKLNVTSEHPLFSLSGSSIRKAKLSDIKSSGEQLKWNKAEDILAGDFLSSVVVDNYVDSDLTPGQARLLGLFAAEGCFSKKYGKKQGAKFTFNITETALANLVKDIVEEEFPECSVKIIENQLRSVITVTVTGYNICEWFYYHTGEYSHEKKLSKELVFSTDEIKRQFILGWLEGDGCVSAGNKLIGVSVSPHLAWQIWTMTTSLKRNVSIRKISALKTFSSLTNEYKYPNSKSYRLEFYGGDADYFCNQSVKYDIKDLVTKRKGIDYFINNRSIHRVLSVEEAPYDGYVYNFEVEEDHSYIANGFVVHNSDIFTEAELKKAHKLWKGRPLCLDHKSSSVDMVRGLVVDTYYDEKRKRVIALCALDKKNYGDLARKVASGYATSVSMGTAVGRAICTEEGCHRVARTEADFCDHMRNKTCYGEINLDLAPIELSIVVSGADPKAKIKTILAHNLNRTANGLSAYMQQKISTGSVSREDLVALQKDLQNLADKVGRLTTEDSGEVALPATESKIDMPQLEESGVTPIQAGAEPIPSYASHLQQAVLGARVKLAKLQDDFNTLSSLIEGSNMTNKRAYFQGTVEPKPGQTQYQPESGELEARMQDKHMQGQRPFPEVGNVDEMYPGYESFGESEVERKRRLQRLAEKNERATRRKEALAAAKRAYFQGTEKPKTYPVDKPGEKVREDDKHMVGAKPFPGVGKVDELYPGIGENDLKLKQKLLRAELKARFKRANNPDGTSNLGESRWDVFAGDKLILSATVDEISRGNAEALFPTIADQKFGKNILSKIRSEGFQKTYSLLKQAQGAPAPAPAAPTPAAPPAAPPMDMGAGMDMGAPEELEAPETGGSAGDEVQNIADDIKDLADDLEDIADDLEDTGKPLAEEAEELAPVEPAAPEQFNEEMPQTTASLQSMRKTLNGLLNESIPETVSDLRAHAQELRLAREVYLKKYAKLDGSSKKEIDKLASQAYRDATETVEDARRLMAAVVKYAHGTAGLIKRAQRIGHADLAGAEGDPLPLSPQDLEQIGHANLAGAEGDPLDWNLSDDDDYGINTPKPEKQDVKPGEVQKGTKDENMAKYTIDTDEDIDIEKLPNQGTLSTKAERAKRRMKLAEKGMAMSEMVNKAHPGGSRKVQDAANLDTAPTAPFAAFHVIDDTHKAMEELANKAPKVRKEAGEIMRLVQAGELDPADVDGLVSLGVDADAVKYWKQMWSEAKDSESKEFANELTKEHVKQASKEEIESEKARLKRAYSLANSMIRRGMLEEGQEDTQVSEMLKWNDAGFESFNSFVNKQPLIKGATGNGITPSVGFLTSEQVLLPLAEGKEQGTPDVRELMEGYLNRPGKKVMF